jgi:glycosyltransferase involved in cell wall biosynthesis
MNSPSLYDLPHPGTVRTGWPWTIATPDAPSVMPGGRPWPRVSIVTPSFNQGNFLEETIRSVLLQGYPDLEYIIIDGGSTDGSLDIIRRYEPWLAYWESTPDRGQAHAINKGWEKAGPGLWAWLNSDDLYLPGTIMKSVQALADNPGTSIVYSGAAFIDENSNLTKRMYDARRLEPGIDRMKYWIRWPIPQPTVFIDSSMIETHGPLDESYHYAMDYEWLVRLSRTERPLFVDDINALYRIHGSSKTGGWEKTRYFFRDECRRANTKNAAISEKILLAYNYLKRKEYPRSAAGNPLPIWRQQLLQHRIQQGKTIIHFSRFPSWPSGDGGIRRTIQIRDILNELAPISISNADGDLQDVSINSPDEDYYCSLWDTSISEDVAKRHEFALRCVTALSSTLRADVAIVDDPIFFQPLVDHLTKLGVPIIGIEHNIETLIQGQMAAARQIKLFEKEIEYFKKCDLVITISHEDTVLLKNFGVNAVVLPYYPNRHLREPFERIRNERAGNGVKKDYLLLGSAYNVPTGAGMYELAKRWNGSSALKGHLLHIAGYGTEKFHDMTGAAGARVKILGPVSDDTLVELLTRVRACVIFQENGTGALTKISELLVAGVPVLANHHAARSYHNMQGIREFDDFTSLERIITGGENGGEFEIPIPEEPDAGPVLRAVRELIAGVRPAAGTGAIYNEELARLRKSSSTTPEVTLNDRDRIAEDFASMYGNIIGKILLWLPYTLYRVYRKYLKKPLK